MPSFFTHWNMVSNQQWKKSQKYPVFMPIATSCFCSSFVNVLLNGLWFQIKSNLIYMAFLMPKRQNKEAKNNNDNPPTPINTQRDIQTHTHTQPHARTHTCTHKHTSSDPLHLSDRDMAGHPDLRQGKSHPWGPTTLRGNYNM